MAATDKDANSDTELMKTYIYGIQFQCLANSITEADKCFQENAQLLYGEKHRPGHECPLVTVQVLAPPKHPDMIEVGRVERQK